MADEHEDTPRGSVTVHRSFTISPSNDRVFALTVRHGVNLPINPGETPEEALDRVDGIVEGKLMERWENLKGLGDVTGPGNAQTAAHVAEAAESGDSSNLDALAGYKRRPRGVAELRSRVAAKPQAVRPPRPSLPPEEEEDDLPF